MTAGKTALNFTHAAGDTMSQADTLIENLRKSKANLDCAREQEIKARISHDNAADALIAARETYRKALAAIESAAE